ncbi:MAG: sugar transferase [Anaerolineae bacterium]|jgi:lipopolysaccharide/colanic/teichoic acid biosynthesis glycosyltransferase
MVIGVRSGALPTGGTVASDAIAVKPEGMGLIATPLVPGTGLKGYLLATKPRGQSYWLAKRLLDVVVAALGLILLSPLFLLLAIVVRLDSPGPALFRQRRVGAIRRRLGDRDVWEPREFTFLKFRTMHHNNDPTIHRKFVQALIRGDEEAMRTVQAQAQCNGNGNGNGHKQAAPVTVKKLQHDPRITRVGRWLRATSLDELPQLWNVLMGDMTLVGPRPAIPYEVEVYEDWHRGRLAAIPGLTGLWQVKARCSVDFDDMVRLDLQYIENQSLKLDLWVLLRTPLAVLSGKGAV